MNTTQNSESAVYQIRVQGVISGQWAEWFGLEIMPLANGEMLLSGLVNDQAALHGILAKIRDLNLPLISVTRIADK
ncbi:MAG: hypothetical protein JW934_22350 [Anaerolineae bacterium]|nr:hypothetical protein [Anaerolineae bacterium]